MAWKEISSELIEKVLEPYKIEYLFLKSAEEEYPLARGIFRVESTPYAKETGQTEYITAVETQVCLNQLTYVAFAEWASQNKFEKQGITLDRFLELMIGNMFIINSDMKFRDKIPSNKDIKGKIKIKTTRKHKSLYIVLLDFDFEEGIFSGRLDLALRDNQAKHI